MTIQNTKINWFGEIKKDENKLPQALDYFMKKYEEFLPKLAIGGSLSREEAELPYLNSICQEDWATLDAIMEHYNIKLRAARSKYYKKYLETYARQLSSNDVKNYVEGEQEIVAFQAIINEINLVKNKFVGLSKGLESKNWQLSNITKIKSLGLDLVEI